MSGRRNLPGPPEAVGVRLRAGPRVLPAGVRDVASSRALGLLGSAHALPHHFRTFLEGILEQMPSREGFDSSARPFCSLLHFYLLLHQIFVLTPPPPCLCLSRTVGPQLPLWQGQK